VSDRELVWETLMDFIKGHNEVFTAPYGILGGLHHRDNGSTIRVITFGVARTSDCTIEVYNPRWILIKESLDGSRVCKTVGEVVDWLRERYALCQ
jgi:hypothetical protein